MVKYQPFLMMVVISVALGYYLGKYEFNSHTSTSSKITSVSAVEKNSSQEIPCETKPGFACQETTCLPPVQACLFCCQLEECKLKCAQTQGCNETGLGCTNGTPCTPS